MSGISRPRPPQAPGPSHLPIDSIKVGQRHRRDPGDIPALAANIREIGLLHPLPVKPNGELIAGARRLAACKHLGWTEVPVHVVDLDVTVKGEYAENEYRKPFLPSENVAIKRELEQLEKAAAKERQREGGRAGGKASGKLPTGSKGRAADMAAKRTGMARRTLEKAEAVVAAAEAEPDKYGKLVEQMDRTGKVDGAHRRLLEARGEKPPTKRQSVDQAVAHAVRVQRMKDAGEIERVNAENRRLTEELKTAHQNNQKPKAANDTIARIAEMACEIIDVSRACEFDNKVSSNLLPLMAQASAAWAELTKRLAAQVEISNAPPPAADDGLGIPKSLDRTTTSHA